MSTPGTDSLTKRNVTRPPRWHSAARRAGLWLALAAAVSLAYAAAQGDTATSETLTTATQAAGGGQLAGAGTFTTLLALFVALVLGSGLVASSETALFSLDKLDLTQLRNSRRIGDRFILRLLDQPNETLVTILLVNTVINICITLVVTAGLEQIVPPHMWWAALVAAAISTIAILFFGEILPKLLASVNPQGASRLLAPPMWAISILIAPLRTALNLVLRVLFRLFHIQESTAAADVSEEELKVMISSGEVSQVLEQDEREMIDGVFDLRRTVAAEILTPRMAVNAVPDDLEQEAMIARLRELPSSRVLVYHENLDELVGFLLVKEVLLTPADPWRKHLREAFCVPDGIGLLDLLRSFRTQRTKMAVVVDEHGGIAGIVTLQDLLEEIVGDMYEKHEHLRQDLVRLGEGRWRANGSLPLSELAAELGATFPEQRARTVGGFVMNMLGRIPRLNDEVEHEGLRLRVEGMVARRVNTVLIERASEPQGPPSAADPGGEPAVKPQGGAVEVNAA